MKKIIFTIFLLPIIAHAGWFDSKKEDSEHDRRIHAEEQLDSTRTELTNSCAHHPFMRAS